MKKILKINAIIIILFSTILMFFSYKNNDSSYWMNWGQTINSQTIYLKNTGYSGSDLFSLLSTLAKESEVNLIKTDYLILDDQETTIKSIYYGNKEEDLFADDSLKEGKIFSFVDNDSNVYLSTKNASEAQCIGRIFDFLNDDKVEFWTLNRFKDERGSLDGDYIIRAKSQESMEYFINELSERSGISIDSLLQQKTFISVEESPIEVISKVGIVVSLGVFTLLGIFYAIQNSKKIGVM